MVGEEVCDSAVRYFLKYGQFSQAALFISMKEQMIPEGHSPVSIAVICPACSKKALLRGAVRDSYKRSFRSVNGMISCTACGFIREDITMNCTDFWYQVPVGDRVLYAIGKENLVEIKEYFKSGRRWDDDPGLDFPKAFYLHRQELVEKVERLLAAEGSGE